MYEFYGIGCSETSAHKISDAGGITPTQKKRIRHSKLEDILKIKNTRYLFVFIFLLQISVSAVGGYNNKICGDNMAYSAVTSKSYSICETLYEFVLILSTCVRLCEQCNMAVLR